MPIHEGIAAALGGLGASINHIGTVGAKLGSRLISRIPVLVVARIAWPLGRTVGLMSNILEPNRRTLFESFSEGDWLQVGARLATQPPFSPYGPLGLGVDFWRGAAYPNAIEAFEGWGSVIGELFVPGTDIRRMAEAMLRLDPLGLIDPGLDRLGESLGLEDVSALFKGMDGFVESIVPGVRPLDAIGGAISGFFAWLDGGVRGLFGPPPEPADGEQPPPPPPPPEPGEPDEEGAKIIVGSGDDEFVDEFVEAVAAALLNVTNLPNDSLTRRIIAELKRVGATGGFSKLIRAVQGIRGRKVAPVPKGFPTPPPTIMPLQPPPPPPPGDGGDGDGRRVIL